jgi:hypothetical protein
VSTKRTWWPGCRRSVAAIAIVAASTAGSACVRQIRNDIDATNSELTGPYSVRRAVEDRTYVADVCVTRRTRSDLVADQIIEQRLSHGHDRIVVNLYGERGGSAERVTWTPEGGRETARLTPGATPECR